MTYLFQIYALVIAAASILAGFVILAILVTARVGQFARRQVEFREFATRRRLPHDPSFSGSHAQF